MEIWKDNYQVYGSRKLWKTARRAGIEIGRDQTARLMRHPGVRCHSDAGSQFTSLRYGERLAEIGAVPSIGTVSDSYDNALAETANGYYKAELIRGPARTGPWKTIEEVELATLGWVHWHNTQRLHGYLRDIPPVEFEALHAAERELKAPDPDELTIADTAPRAADRLPAPQTQPRDRQIASNPPPHAITASTAPELQPTTHPDSSTLPPRPTSRRSVHKTPGSPSNPGRFTRRVSAVWPVVFLC